jgi:hypothetical protein
MDYDSEDHVLYNILLKTSLCLEISVQFCVD